jgi:deoxyribonuclease (pyrimidine dimer)
MTRINTIEPKLLPMPWLVAEYRELPRVLNQVACSGAFKEVPSSYRMGEGHVSFFGDKLAWLHYRHELLRAELMRRGSKELAIDTKAVLRRLMRSHLDLCGDWNPGVVDHFVNLQRLKDSWLRSKRMCPSGLNTWLLDVILHHKLPAAMRFELLPIGEMK